MTKFSLVFIFLAIISCNLQNKGHEPTKIIKRYNYKITIDIWNGYFGHESKFILNNLGIDSDDSIVKKIQLSKPLTLYYVSFHSVQGENDRKLVPTDTTEIPFSKNLSDTLFLLTKDFFKNFEFSNYDTVGQIVPIVTDDSHGMVELNYNGRKLSATISSIGNPTIAPRQLDTLLGFVDKFRPFKKE
jgi:hypothetical protein